MYSGRYHFDVPNTFLFVFFSIVIFTHLLSFPSSIQSMRSKYILFI